AVAGFGVDMSAVTDTVNRQVPTLCPLLRLRPGKPWISKTADYEPRHRQRRMRQLRCNAKFFRIRRRHQQYAAHALDACERIDRGEAAEAVGYQIACPLFMRRLDHGVRPRLQI